MDDDIDASLELQHGATEGDLTSRQDKARTSDVVKGSSTSRHSPLSMRAQQQQQHLICTTPKDVAMQITAPRKRRTQKEICPDGFKHHPSCRNRPPVRARLRHRWVARHPKTGTTQLLSPLARCLPANDHSYRAKKKTDTARLNIGLSPPLPFTQAVGDWGRPDRPDYVTETSHFPPLPGQHRTWEPKVATTTDADDEDRGGGGAGQNKTRQDRIGQNKIRERG